jgi:hypothetical protein
MSEGFYLPRPNHHIWEMDFLFREVHKDPYSNSKERIYMRSFAAWAFDLPTIVAEF